MSKLELSAVMSFLEYLFHYTGEYPLLTNFGVERVNISDCNIWSVDWQMSHFFPVEPVGAKAPTFSSDLKSGSFVRKAGQGFGLLCQAQAYPVPSFR
jgi:hypothetical protein